MINQFLVIKLFNIKLVGSENLDLLHIQSGIGIKGEIWKSRDFIINGGKSPLS